ncbi:MAG: hypothetical protein FWG57_01080 [Endomicrobia bacterium]|nr:hypothetical protein [Endomicrobiia bacterium]
MNKKILSCVLAFMFCFSIATNAVAVDSVSTNSGNNPPQLPLTIEGQTQSLPSNEYVEGVVGRILQVFNYKQGELVSVISADKTISILSAGKMRAEFGIDPLSGNYTMSSLNLYAADVAAIEAAGDLKSFLLSIGMSESQLQVTTYGYDDADKDGIVSEEREDVSWLDLAMSTLGKGGSISIGATSSGGATLTVANAIGKSEAVYGATKGDDGQPTLIQEYKYNELGFIKSIVSHNWAAKIDGLNETQAQMIADAGIDIDNMSVEDQATLEAMIRDNNWSITVNYVAAVSTTHFDLMGRQSFITDNEGVITATFHYSSNGALDKVASRGTDGTVASTTHYANNMPSYVTNDKGSIVAQYKYGNNNLLQYVSAFTNGLETSRTVFMLGHQIMTVDTSAKGAIGISYQDYVQGYRDMRAPGADIGAIEDKLHVTSFALLYSDLSNANLLNSLKVNGGFNDADIARMRKDSNGYAAVGMIGVSINKDAIISQTTKYFDGDTEITEAQYKSMQEQSSAVTATGRFTDTGRTIRAEQTTVKGTRISHTITVMNHGAQAYSVKGASFDRDLQPGVTETVESFEFREARIVNSDPAVFGTIGAYYDVFGNVIEDVVAFRKANPDAIIYAMLSANGINMMDGSGFAAADGEEIMINISSLSDEELTSLSQNGSGLFMGDVEKTQSGQYLMTINKNYNVEVNGISFKGFVTGENMSAALQEVDAQSKAALNGEAKYGWMNANTEANRAIFGLNSGSYLNDWKAGWSILAGWN